MILQYTCRVDCYTVQLLTLKRDSAVLSTKLFYQQRLIKQVLRLGHIEVITSTGTCEIQLLIHTRVTKSP